MSSRSGCCSWARPGHRAADRTSVLSTAPRPPHRPELQQRDCVCSGTQRASRNPREFGGDMDAMRAHLHREAAGRPGFIAALLNGISGSAFGDLTASSPGGLVDGLGKAYRGLVTRLQGVGRPPSQTRGRLLFPPPENDVLWKEAGKVETFWRGRGYGEEPDKTRVLNATLGLFKVLSEGGGGSAARQLAHPVDLATRMDSLTAILLCSPTDVANMVNKAPEVLELEPPFVLNQMVTLKSLLPGADIARMIELRPSMLLERELGGRLRPQLALLRTYLPGVAIEELVQEYPYILFEEIESGLKEFRELWPNDIVDETTLAGSTHHELVLAIRALSTGGAPTKWAAGGME